MSNDNHARDLSGEIDRLSRDGGHRPDELLRFLVEDILAGFGKRLETPWSAHHREHLLHLSGLQPDTAGLSAVQKRKSHVRRVYLDRRGLYGAKLDAEVVRFHPALGYWQRDDRNEMKLVGRYPAMVALVTDTDGAPVTVHRTYLTRDGRKAPVPNPKKLMGYPGNSLAGGAIRMFAPGPELGVAEGIETALAVHLRTGMPVWPTVSAGLLARLEPPAGASFIVVWVVGTRSRTDRALLFAFGQPKSVAPDVNPLPGLAICHSMSGMAVPAVLQVRMP